MENKKYKIEIEFDEPKLSIQVKHDDDVKVTKLEIIGLLESAKYHILNQSIN